MERRKKVQVWVWARRPGSLDAKEVQILLLKTIPTRGEFWQPVTGHVEVGEQLSIAALREAWEETGITFEAVPKPIGYSFQFESQWGPAEEEAFSLEAPQSALGPTAIKLDSTEHTELKWVTPDEAMPLLKWQSNRDALLLFMTRMGLF